MAEAAKREAEEEARSRLAEQAARAAVAADAKALEEAKRRSLQAQGSRTDRLEAAAGGGGGRRWREAAVAELAEAEAQAAAGEAAGAGRPRASVLGQLAELESRLCLWRGTAPLRRFGALNFTISRYSRLVHSDHRLVKSAPGL